MWEFFVTDNHQITSFDFDDSQYHWFIYDLATTMGSIQYMFDKNNWNFNYDHVLNLLVTGYLEENTLEDIWFKRISAFMTWRSALLYFWITTRQRKNQILPEDLESVEVLKKRTAHFVKKFDSSILL